MCTRAPLVYNPHSCWSNVISHISTRTVLTPLPFLEGKVATVWGEIWLRLTAIHCHRVSFAPAFHIHVLIMINNKQPGGVRSDLAKLVLIASEKKFLFHDWYTLGNYNGLQTTARPSFSCCGIHSYGEDLHANIHT